MISLKNGWILIQFSYKYIMNSFVVNYGDKMAQIFNFNNSNIK